MKQIVLVLLVIGILALVTINVGPSQEYWEAVGPRWDRMLNPCKYEECLPE